MTTPPSSEFSYDLYPGLDADLEAALARNIANGVAADPAQVATSGLASVVGNVINQPGNIQLAPEAQAWGQGEIVRAGTNWLQYGDVLQTATLNSPQQLRVIHPNLDRKIQHLYDDREQLVRSGYKTPEGTPIGETMKLVLVPWQLFKDHLGTHQTMLTQMRSRQSQVTLKEDYINEQLLDAINNNTPMYRPQSRPGDLITAAEYLDGKIKQDGPWGVMLAQTSNDAGIEQYKGKSPDDLTITANGHDNLRLKQVQVDQMGIFEWWALTLQEDPSQLSNSDYSWLLANRLDVNGVARVPCGYWNGGRVDSRLGDAGHQAGDVRPRLAVM